MSFCCCFVHGGTNKKMLNLKHWRRQSNLSKDKKPKSKSRYKSGENET